MGSAVKLPPPSQLDYLMFVGYLLDGREKLTAPGRGGYLELYGQKDPEGMIYFLDWTADGKTTRAMVATITPERIEFVVFERGAWQGQLEQTYSVERTQRPKRISAGSDATGVPA